MEQLDLERLHTELLDTVECQLCYNLLYKPLTTPCSHTFCRSCFSRSLDHSEKCPLCRSNLPSFAFFQEHPGNQLLTNLITTQVEDLYEARRISLEQEERDAYMSTSIFVCTLAFPGMPTVLHTFEPRYRLMIRRCLESGNPRTTTGPVPRVSPYGTMLQIKSVQMLPDGRSMLETVGSYRFRLLKKGSLDGYTVGRIENIDDLSPPEQADLEASASTAELVDVCMTFVATLRLGSAPWLLTRLNHTYGPMPEAHEVERLGYWIALIMPIGEHEKAKLLPICSSRLRLRLVVHWIEQLRQSSWWFSSGCNIA
ncbi:LON-domain-containing protein [Tilletiaria anomala UBC 951]|uniref:LON-domain-containing protein n=1 Tax=Tilletiaria anomala (strain ATCC 24038 / CBS 436.72 / UBC 951) TaxID=1037660 RepID=A0A066WK93_TILAU|nr:LON-domain-containing protein [Tilletiaria anomala UBC 951]KDN51439.1 LON-domain-containing protein [Tilletiaria anomala UBC 951]